MFVSFDLDSISCTWFSTTWNKCINNLHFNLIPLHVVFFCLNQNLCTYFSFSVVQFLSVCSVFNLAIDICLHKCKRFKKKIKKVYSFFPTLESNLVRNDRKTLKTCTFSSRNTVAHKIRGKRRKWNPTIYRMVIKMCLMHCIAIINSQISIVSEIFHYDSHTYTHTREQKQRNKTKLTNEFMDMTALSELIFFLAEMKCIQH